MEIVVAAKIWMLSLLCKWFVNTCAELICPAWVKNETSSCCGMQELLQVGLRLRGGRLLEAEIYIYIFFIRLYLTEMCDYLYKSSYSII